MKSALAILAQEVIEESGTRFTIETVAKAILEKLNPQMLWDERETIVREYARNAIRRTRQEDRRSYENAVILEENGPTRQFVLFEDMDRRELVSLRRECHVQAGAMVKKHNAVTRYMRNKFAALGLAILKLVEVQEEN